MAYPASLIAQLFVNRAIKEGNPITQMKLQKIVYFAHGLYLASHNEPLIKENFQAWKFGPVVPDIYHTYKFYGSTPITDTDWVLKKDFHPELVDNEAKEVIEDTWEALKDANTIQLSNWTHQKGSPWANHFIQGVNDITIPNEEIGKYFEQFLTK